MESTSENDALSPVKRALLKIRTLRAEIAQMKAARQAPVAIVGIGLRLPGGMTTLDSYWSALESGRCCITEVPAQRWDLDRYYSSDMNIEGRMYSRHGAFLDDVDQFDPEFFSLTAREARSLDPQQRLLLEVAWEALEDAGIAPPSLKGSPTGVYLGLSNSDYGRMLLQDAESIDTQSVIGGALSIAAGRIAYFLNLRGPAMAIDTACSSSLVALHLACNSLRSGETDLAIAGGANLLLLPEASIGFSKTGMLARDGRCKVFDRDADGYVRGEGCIAIILKRLDDAQRDGHRIHALIRGSAVNQDGRSAGLTAPNGPSQQALMQSALQAADVRPSEVSYVECHGTGTPLGDPIEVQALANVYSEGRRPDQPLLIGSVKANLGHLEAAAGLAGLVKTVLALKHDSLPHQINLQDDNPHIPWSDIPVSVTRAKTAWHRTQTPRIAGVSAFGFSGTNVHVLLEEAPARTRVTHSLKSPRQVLCLSARTPEALRDLAVRYVEVLASDSEALSDLCFTANAGRAHHRERLALRGASASELLDQLNAWLTGDQHPCVVTGSVADRTQDRAADTPVSGIRESTGSTDAQTQSLQHQYCAGADMDWEAVYAGQNAHRVSLPFYPFERRSFWLSPRPSAEMPSFQAPLAEVSALVLGSPRSAADAVMSLPSEDRAAWMMEHVTQCVRRVLELDAGFELKPRDRLTELGIDSLIALELKSVLANSLDLGDRLPSTIAFDAGTIEGLARLVLHARFPNEAPAVVKDRAAHTLSVQEISALSDEEVEQLLAARMSITGSHSG